MKLDRKTPSYIYRTFLLLGLIGLVMACSRKKNKWLNRNYHAMSTYYNILFNGNNALQDGVDQLNRSYVDDYWDILPVERMMKTGKETEYGKMIMLDQQRRTPPQRATPKKKEKSKDQSNSRNRLAAGKSSTSQNARDKQDGKSRNTNNNRKNGGNANFPQNPNTQGGINNGRTNMPNNSGGINNQGGMRNQGGMNNQRGMNNRGQMNGGNRNMPNNRGGMNNRGGISNQGQMNGNNNRGGMNKPGGMQNQGSMNNPGGRIPNRGGGIQNAIPSNQGQGGNQMGVSSQTGPSFSQNSGNSQRNLSAGFGGKSTEEKPSKSTGENFERAEEKASKAIQKHNMLIHGTEYNPQMINSFLLLGKARYYDQRYFPALEAFNYILNKYEDDDLLASAEIWREKAYMRLENYDRVIENLPIILNSGEELSQEDIVQGTTALAEAYIKTDEIEKALEPLTIAINTTDNYAKKGRYQFIKGQIYQRLNKIDSSNQAFNRVISYNRKPPRIYRISSFMEKADNFDYKTENHATQLDTLHMLAENRENRPFLDMINYRLATYYKATDSMSTAVNYYNKSLRTGTEDHGLKYRIYNTLANYNFDQAHYKTAGAYFDSTMVNVPEDSRRYRDLRRKRLNLSDVIYYEEIAFRNDSILNLVQMAPKKRQAYFEKYVDSLKTEAVAQAQKAKKEAKRSKMGNPFGRQQSQALGGSSGGNFYFYTPSQVSMGKTTFENIWGKRELQDNWRMEKGSPKKNKNKDEAEEEIDYMAQIESNPQFQAETYLEQIPEDKEVIDSISADRNFAYYQLGVIYKEKFKEYQLAADKLEALLQQDPEERLILPTKYNLYKTYQQLDNNAKVERWKQDILTNYPDSRYASIIRNPSSLRNDETNPMKVYNRVYKTYKAGNYEQTLQDCEKYITRFMGEDIIPKFELLKATVKGRLYGFQSYKEGLNYVALTYPQSKEGKHAEKIISDNLSKIKKGQFVRDAKDQYNLIYIFTKDNDGQAEQLQKTLNEAIADYEYEGLTTSIDTYSSDKIFVVVHGLNSKMGAEGFGIKLQEDEDYELTHKNFGISSINYETILIHKNLKDYLKEYSD